MKKNSSKTNRTDWNAAKVRRVLNYYEKQTDEQAAREIEQAPVVRSSAWIEVPMDLVPQVKRLIARQRKIA